MVILWSYLDDNKQDPAEKLEEEAQLPDGAKQIFLAIEHPTVSVRPPSGRTSRSPRGNNSTSPPQLMKEHIVGSTSPTPSGSHLVCVKDITDIISQDKGLVSGQSSFRIPPKKDSPPGKSISLVDSCKNTHIPQHEAILVTLGRNGSLKRNSGDDVDGTILLPKLRSGRRKFSTLPRSWRNHASQLLSGKGKTLCEKCNKKCSGEVLRVHEKYFHMACFNCAECKKSLAHGGFFSKEKAHFCTDCYQKNFGQRCATCGTFVEGEVVSALGNTYHQKCFLCARCRQPFPSGEKVTYTGKECLCQKCFQIPLGNSQSPITRSPTLDGAKCSGCHTDLVEGQALIALDQQWHIWCFKCASCNILLHGEYMGKDGLPYCEKDYQSQFGVKCAYCDRFITGKVLQAGDNHHFHPTCARCSKCGDPFGDGEEMYLQGTAIWHPRCGPGPTSNGTVLNGSLLNGHVINEEQKHHDKDLDGVSSTASETQFFRSHTPSLNGSFRSSSPYNNSLNRKYSGPYRTCSPGLLLREYKSSPSPIDVSRIYTYSYLAAEPTQSYLRRPIDPYDRPPKSPHFHRPPPDTRKMSLPKTSSKLGMRALVETIQTDTPRPKSPKMNNEEPIILAHYPGAKPPLDGVSSRIERDDFPAPPYPYTDPERRRRWSGSSKGVSVDETDGVAVLEDDDFLPEDPKLKKEEEELNKISTGIGKVFLQQVREREKIRAWKATHVDPRSASRTPSANKEPGYKMRYDSSINASPSRLTDHVRPWEDDEFDGGSYHCSTGRSSSTLPYYNVISSLRGEPKPGYNLKSSTLPAAGRNGSMIGDYHMGLGEKTHSTEFSSARSDASAGSLTEADRSALNPDMCPSATYSSGLRGYTSSPHMRRSLPNMHHTSGEPPKIYPAHLLLITNYRLPNDVDRCHLERHLSDADFEMVFRMSRMEFYRMSEWKRNDFKRRMRLF